MRYIKIQSKGIIDLKSLIIVKSAKSNDSSKIGMFGSGIKYSLSVLFRENIVSHLFVGNDLIPIETKKDCFNWDTGQEDKSIEYEQLYINGKPSSFTIDSGPKWELWMVLRELYSNALDQTECSMEVVEELVSREGYTTWYLQMNEALENVWKDIHKIFSEFRSDITWFHEENKVFYQPLSPSIVYRKGIRASDHFGSGYFSYDLQDVDINESRIMNNKYTVWCDIVKLWSNVTDSKSLDLLIKAFSSQITPMEVNIFTSYGDNLEPNSIWKKYFEGKEVGLLEYKDFYNPGTLVPKIVYAKLKAAGVKMESKIDIDHHYATREADAHEQIKLKKALEFLEECGYKVSCNCIPVITLDREDRLFHLTKDNTILVDCAGSVKDIAKLVIIASNMPKAKFTSLLPYTIADQFIDYMERKNLLPL